MSKSLRRVVTGHDANGQAVIVSDGPVDRVFDNLGEPGLVFHEVWNTQETPARIDRQGGQPPEPRLMLAPPKGGGRIRVLDIPPEQPGVKFEAVFENIGAEHALLDKGERKAANMHRTETIDYGIVLEGELVLTMDEGETTVRAGDIVVQRGTNHGWTNRSTANCRIAFILVDGKFDDELK